MSLRRLTTGCWHANHALTVVDPGAVARRVVLRRWARPGWELDDPDFTARREATVLELLAGSAIPAPRLIAADPGAVECDVPTLLITHLPGRLPGLQASMDAFLMQLARALAAVHAVDAADVPIPGYRRYVDPAALGPPPWSGRPALWEQAIELAGTPPPSGPAGLIHRDFHPENTLFLRGRLTGIVDWTSGSLGQLAVDVGHMRWNLAVDYGLDAAQEFRRLYRSLSSNRASDQSYWDVVTLLDVVGQAPEAGDWSPFEVARLERYLESVMAAP